MPASQFPRHQITSRARHTALGLCVLVASVGVMTACRKSEEGVTISGDIEGLDTLGLRGASLLAKADSQPSLIDSLRAIAEGRVSSLRMPRKENASDSAADSASSTARPGENPMAARARMLADSMIRASAQQTALGSSASATTRDTVRGVVTVIGSDPVRQVVLRTVNGATTYAMSGMATTGMSKLEGLELVVRGVQMSPRDIVVANYLVRAANGVPAFDGTLVANDGAWYLQLTDGTGRKRIAALPSALRENEGQRVWVAISPSSNAVESFGVIPRR